MNTAALPADIAAAKEYHFSAIIAEKVPDLARVIPVVQGQQTGHALQNVQGQMQQLT